MYRTTRSLPLRTKRWTLAVAALVVVGAAAGAASQSARALTINVIYDPSVGSAPSGFEAAVQEAINFFESTFSEPVTVNIGVGWGEVGGYAIASGNLGESETYLAGYYSYGQVRNALNANAKSSADSAAIASLPTVDPTGGRSFVMANAEANALGLRTGGTDGFVGFDSTASWTFDPNNRAVAGKYDLIGVAEHEISEVLGRFSDLGTVAGTLDPLDLYRYSGPNTRALSAGYGQYFSIDSGNTNLITFNGPNGGDLGDWAGNTLDAFNAFGAPGVLMPFSPADITELDALGYDVPGQPVSTSSAAAPSSYTFHFSFGFGIPTAQATDVPEPGSLMLLAPALLGLGCLSARRTWRRFRG